MATGTGQLPNTVVCPTAERVPDITIMIVPFNHIGEPGRLSTKDKTTGCVTLHHNMADLRRESMTKLQIELSLQ